MQFPTVIFVSETLGFIVDFLRDFMLLHPLVLVMGVNLNPQGSLPFSWEAAISGDFNIFRYASSPFWMPVDTDNFVFVVDSVFKSLSDVWSKLEQFPSHL